jgi:hypothetical protein
MIILLYLVPKTNESLNYKHYVLIDFIMFINRGFSCLMSLGLISKQMQYTCVIDVECHLSALG